MKGKYDYHKSDEFLAILKEYEDCEKRNVPCIISSEDYADIAEYYDNNNLTEQALRAIDAALDIYPGEIYPLALRARFALVHNHNPQEARFYANQIEDKGNMEYHYLMAEIFIAEKQTEKADSYLEKVFEDIDEDELEESILDVASLFTDYEQYETSWKWLQKIDERDDEEYLLLLGRTLEGLGRNEESEKVFNKLIDIDAFSSDYWDCLAATQYNQHKFNESISSSEYSIALNPDNDEATLNIANGLYSLGNYAEALSYYERYNKLRPDDEYGELFSGICLINLDRNEEALEHLLRAEKIAPPYSNNLTDICQEIAFAKDKTGDLEGALASLDKAAQLNGNHAELLVLKGQFYLEHNQTEEAQLCFNNAIRESNSAPDIFYRIAVAAYEAGYVHMAGEMLDILYKNTNWNKGYSYMAVCQFLGNNMNRFYEYLQKAVEQDAREAKLILGYMFPEGMDPSEYYQYAISNYSML
ncbi:MAG: tetratricopeptide repeat protein [Prevotella sp.]|nr:tetratricopeptide repeat protein [Prevotella sp.]